MCKPCMFSYPAEVWQTRAVERAENRLDRAVPSSSGEPPETPVRIQMGTYVATPLNRGLPRVTSRPPWSRFFSRIQLYNLHRQIPMSVENLKAPLLLAMKRFLIGIHLLLQRRLIERFIRHGGILEDNGHAVVPAPVFGGVIARLV